MAESKVGASTEALLEVRSVRAGYGQREVLRGVDFTVQPGALWAVLGPNGAGKSTLMRVCLGLQSISGGAVKLLGQDVSTLPRPQLARAVAWVPQSAEVTPDFTGLELVLMGRSPHLGLWGLPSAGDIERATQVLSELGISHLAGRSSAEVSGGERRLLLLARALVQDPQLLVLDEPTAFLDQQHQVEALGRVRARVKRGLGAIAVLHDVNLAVAFADQVLLLKDGAVLESGPAASVLRSDTLERLYGTPLVAAEVNGQPLFAPRWDR